jgi:hypothetical protein
MSSVSCEDYECARSLTLLQTTAASSNSAAVQDTCKHCVMGTNYFDRIPLIPYVLLGHLPGRVVVV